MSLLPVPDSFDALLAGVKRERVALNAVLSQIPPERMSEANAVGIWSIKDVMAHLAVWLSRDITLLFFAERDGKPAPAHVSLKTRDWDKVNAKDYAEQKDRPLERIEQDFHGTHTQLLKRLETWRARDHRMLFDAAYYPTMLGASLASEVWGSSAEHDCEHRLDIEAWLKRSPQ